VVGERAGQLDRRLRALEDRDRLGEEVETAFPALDQPRGAQRTPSARGSPKPRATSTAARASRRASAAWPSRACAIAASERHS
jgi:hypothetical protein